MSRATSVVASRSLERSTGKGIPTPSIPAQCERHAGGQGEWSDATKSTA
jgi:hypothetical protein